MISLQATKILGILVEALPKIIPGRPETYLGYKQVHDHLQLALIGPTYGESLKKQGLEELAVWTVELGYPGITGLVIDRSTYQPGEGYFRVFGKREDFSWWEDEIRKAKEFNWKSIHRAELDMQERGRSTSLETSTEFPAVSQYVNAFRNVLPTAPASHIAMLRAHFIAKDRTITATELAYSAGYANYNAANLQYGTFAQSLCTALQFRPPVGNSGEPTATFVLASPQRFGSREEWKWIMRAPVAAALEEIWGSDAEPQSIRSDDLPEDKNYLEGSALQVLVNRYERNPDARTACLDYWGAICCVCEMDFSQVYGIENSRGIHVHHLIPISDIKAEYTIDPVNDLRPVCPNCHTALHSMSPPISPDVLRKRYRGRKKDM